MQTYDDETYESGLSIVQIDDQPKRRPTTNAPVEEEEEEEEFVDNESALALVRIRDIRSQRLSDTYPIRQMITDQPNGIFSRLLKRFSAFYILQPLIHFLFPRVLNNYRYVALLGFQRTTQVKLLCPWTCPDGHICQYTEGHSGPHKCVFNHTEGAKIAKCMHVCDARHCDGRCALAPGHSGTHKCHFRHYPRDIPANRAEQEAFRDDKAIGDYIDELAYSTAEDIKYSHIPEPLDESDESWTEN